MMIWMRLCVVVTCLRFVRIFVLTLFCEGKVSWLWKCEKHWENSFQFYRKLFLQAYFPLYLMLDFYIYLVLSVCFYMPGNQVCFVKMVCKGICKLFFIISSICICKYSRACVYLIMVIMSILSFFPKYMFMINEKLKLFSFHIFLFMRMLF